MRSVALVSLVTLAACGTSSSNDADFADATQPQLDRALFAAGGADVALASFMAVVYQLPPPGAAGCPTVSRDAQGAVHVQGGCTTSDGTTIDGAATFTNVPDLSGGGNDPTRPSHLAYDHFTAADASGVMAFDGTIDLDAHGATAAIAVTLLGIVTQDDFTFACNGACTYAGGASIDVDGIGTASVAGTFTTSNPAHVDLQLRGVDELDVRDDGSCVVFSGAATGRFCQNGK